MLQSIFLVIRVYQSTKLMLYERYKSTNDDNRENVKSLISANHAGKPVTSHFLATPEMDRLMSQEVRNFNRNFNRSKIN